MLSLKKIFFCILLLSSFSYIAHAGDTLYYSGNITVSKQATLKYILRFTIDSANRLTGYSLTDPHGPNETKAKITGTYDSVAKAISFKEVAILRPKVDTNKTDICFVTATLKLKKTRVVEELSGNFTGLQPGKTTACATGVIKLINTARAKLLLAEMAKYEKKGDSNGKEKDDGQVDIIKVFNDKPKVLPFTGDYVKLTIWDNGKVDGDRISIMLNDKYILEDYTLDSTVKIIETALSGNPADTIKIIALNEGDLPPNTAVIQIESKTEQYPIEVQAKLNEVRRIILKKNKR